MFISIVNACVKLPSNRSLLKMSRRIICAARIKCRPSSYSSTSHAFAKFEQDSGQTLGVSWPRPSDTANISGKWPKILSLSRVEFSRLADWTPYVANLFTYIFLNSDDCNRLPNNPYGIALRCSHTIYDSDLKIRLLWTRLRTRLVTTPCCFFCEKGEETGQSDGRLWQVGTFAVDTRVRECASLLDDFRLLSKLSEGDMIATEAWYHTGCLVAYYNHNTQTFVALC